MSPSARTKEDEAGRSGPRTSRTGQLHFATLHVKVKYWLETCNKFKNFLLCAAAKMRASWQGTSQRIAAKVVCTAACASVMRVLTTHTCTHAQTHISSKTHTLARPCSAGVYIQRLLSVAWIVNQRFRRTCSDWGKFFNHFFVLRRPSRHLTFLASLQLRLLQLAMPCKKLEKTNYNCIYLDL